MDTNVIEVDNLKTQFSGKRGTVTAVDGVSFSIKTGSCLSVVGESGCGKSVTALSILRLIPKTSGKIAGGSINFQERDLTKLSEKEIREIRGNSISMIFQDSMTGLNPVMTIGKQLKEAISVHDRNLKKDEVEAKALELLRNVGIPSPEKRIKEYPHQLSGGMRQRVMIAMALCAGNTKLLIADEPTTALDVTIQAQILDLMRDLKKKKNTSIMLITHDMGVVAEMADYVLVMYAGKEMEYAEVSEIFSKPLHPYTEGLLLSIPRLNQDSSEELHTIEGNVPDLSNMPKGCRFSTRCQYVFDKCREKEPALFDLNGHKVRCWKYEGEANA